VGDMAEHVPPELSEHLRRHASELTDPFLLSTQADRVRAWSTPGTLVIGDAAHTMSPVGGQGINIALRDAVVAANELVPVLRGGCDPAAIDAACHRVQELRAPEVHAIQRMQAMPPRLVLARSWWGEGVRTIPELLRFAPVRALAGRAVAPFAFGTTQVSLEV